MTENQRYSPCSKKPSRCIFVTAWPNADKSQ